MSKKGNFGHYKHGSRDGKTLDDVPLIKTEDRDYPGNTRIIVCDSTSENVEFVDSIQDGFHQTEILCEFVCNAGTSANDLPVENTGMDIESLPGFETNPKFADSPASCKIESFYSVSQGFDEQIDNYLLTDFQKVNKPSSGDGNNSSEEQKSVTEAISEIAKSFGFDDLLPESFQFENNKEMTNSRETLCDEGNDIGDLSLGDFEKCAILPASTTTPLDLVDQLPTDAQLQLVSGLEMLADAQMQNKSTENILNVINVANEKENFNVKEDSIDVVTNENSELFKVPKLGVASNQNVFLEEDICDIQEADCEIPTVSILDSEIGNSDDMQNCSAGTVFITRDRVSKKMQIVLTLDQGQQVFDIDTENIDIDEQSLDLDVQTPMPEETVPEEQEVVSFNNSESLASNGLEENNESLEASYIKILSSLPAIKEPRTPKRWPCPIDGCGQVLDKECKLKVHLISHKSESRPFKCDYEGCDWAFTTPYRLRRHAETHLGSKDFVCEFEGCNRKFTTIYNLKTHIKQHRWPNCLACPSKGCELIFSNRRQLELHLKVHKDIEAPYKCVLCGKQYYSANCLASHHRTHQYNEDDFKCPFPECGKVYDKVCRLRQHVRHHTGDRPYICPAQGCTWSFMSASKLTRHMRKHTGERKFTCNEPGCGKSFMRPEHLKGHVVIHSGDKPFHCPHENCNARFTAKSSLYVHVKKHCSRSLKVVFPCPIEICDKKYNMRATLRQHLLKFHQEEIERQGKIPDIIEKLELTMPVSIVEQTSETAYLELAEDNVDDPVPVIRIEDSFSLAKLTGNSKNTKSVPKTKAQNSSTGAAGNKKTLKTSDKLVQIRRHGCARTDFCCKGLSKNEPKSSLLSLCQNSTDNHDSGSFLSSQISTDIKLPDVMLSSSIIFQEHSTEPLLKPNFLQDDCSSRHSLYHDDSILAGGSTFEAELIPAALLSDNVESDDSVLNSSVSAFSEQNCVNLYADFDASCP